MLRILEQFTPSETRDELGLGAIRDSVADILFPGTSTIQTRLRYMLFVPWVYRELERRGVRSKSFKRQAEEGERDLIDTLKPYEGAFGKRGGRNIKRLPSSVYWSGLGTWKIREVLLSQESYLRTIDDYYAESSAWRQCVKRREEAGDEANAVGAPTNWHPDLPEPPADWPVTVDFKLTRTEARFIRDQIQHSHGSSLLAHLATSKSAPTVQFPWEHPGSGRFAPEHQELLRHSRLFSELMHGAALLYNLALSDLTQVETKQTQYREEFFNWLQSLPLKELKLWEIDCFWRSIAGKQHVVTLPTKHFVDDWRKLVLETNGNLLRNKSAARLIELREQTLKGGRSRYSNEQARQQWKGESGLRRIDYRWRNVQRLLQDLLAGLSSRN
jgi:hypothetical protein